MANKGTQGHQAYMISIPPPLKLDLKSDFFLVQTECSRDPTFIVPV